MSQVASRKSRVMCRVLGVAVLVMANICLAATLVTSSIDGGGGRSSSSNYVNDACIGGVGAIGTGGAVVNKGGYPGQLYEVKSVTLDATPVSVDEGATRQVTAVAVMNDNTFLALQNSDPDWRVGGWPLASVSVTGLVTAGTVYQATTGDVAAVYQSTTGSLLLVVVDTDDDNFGAYAADGLPDGWQVKYFGTNNPTDGGPGADPDRDGGDNRYEHTTGTHPVSGGDLFRITGIARVAGATDQVDVTFAPAFADRDYRLQRAGAMTGVSWTVPAGTTQATNGTDRTARDPTAMGTPGFYRVRVTYVE
jgi:hypothetical protein